MTKSKPSKFGIQPARGAKTKPGHKKLLATIAVRLFAEHGLTVLSGSGDFWARTPGQLSWFCVAYVYDPKATSSTPFGCVRVSFIRNGSVSVQVMGVKAGVQSEFVNLDLTWKE